MVSMSSRLFVIPPSTLSMLKQLSSDDLHLETILRLFIIGNSMQSFRYSRDHDKLFCVSRRRPVYVFTWIYVSISISIFAFRTKAIPCLVTSSSTFSVSKSSLRLFVFSSRHLVPTLIYFFIAFSAKASNKTTSGMFRLLRSMFGSLDVQVSAYIVAYGILTILEDLHRLDR